VGRFSTGSEDLCNHFLSPATHAIVHVQDVRFDLVTRPVLRDLSHFQHVEDSSGVPIAPLDERRQDCFQIGSPQFASLCFTPREFQGNLRWQIH
jgi:hypothetical protein